MTSQFTVRGKNVAENLSSAALNIDATRDQWDEMADCPFCHAKAADFNISVTYSQDLDGVVRNYMGECAQCGAMGPTAPKPIVAIRFWNDCGDAE